MTPQSIQNALQFFFSAVYPNVPVTVIGAGEKHIEVHVRINPKVDTIWECDLDSDDDGFFRFYLADTTICINVPYPEED